MRSLLAVTTSLAVITGIVSTNLWLQLRNERVLFADMRTQLTEARGAARVPPPVAVSAPAPAPAAACPAVAVPACKPATAAPAVNLPAADTSRVVNQIQVSERDLLKDPEYRKARLAMRRLDMERGNPGVAEALGLSEREADKLFDLLAENQIRWSELPSITFNRDNPLAAGEENARRQKQQDESLIALLGTSGFAQWQEYQTTRGARSQAASMGTQLLQIGLPLTSAQLKPLTEALIADQRRQTQESQSIARIPNNADPQARAAAQEDALRRTAENNRRILVAIAPSLNHQQLAVFREQFEMQETMNRTTVRARERAMAARGTVQ